MRTVGRREVGGALLGTLILAVVLSVLVAVGLRTGHLGRPADPVPTESPVAQPSPPSPTTPPESSPTPEPTLTVIPPDPALAAAFAEQSAARGGVYALVWVDGDGLHALGLAPDDTAWSTIKVPLAIAALERAATTGAAVTRDVEAAITRSDNPAAARLWTSLGPTRDAAGAVDEVLTAYDSVGTRTEDETVRPPFSAYGQTRWSVTDQARFAAALSCADPDSAAAQVRAAMGRVTPEHRWGIGQLDSAHLKGGWGPDVSGAYLLRQLGDVTVDGRTYALAASAQSGTGSYARGAADLTALVQWWADEVAPDAPGLSCPGSGPGSG
ncbi:MAG TPA: hypothetical protein GXZ60_06455 [Intrasporangiaceae bacterium]|nr:hypothetical protein [Intrasporangiaceae bacterium]